MHGGEQPQVDVVEWAQRGEECGAGESYLLLWGAMGPKTVLIAFDQMFRNPRMSQQLRVGSRNTRTFLSRSAERKADALLAASVFHYGELTIRDVKII